MCKPTYTIITVLLFAAAAFAGLPKAYVSFNFGTATPAGQFAGTNLLNSEGGAKPGSSGDLDFGVTTGKLSGYVGYLFGKHSAHGNVGSETNPYWVNGDWSLNRFLIGVRVSPFDFAGAPVKPFAGFGLSTGKTAAATSLYSQGIPAITKKSKTSWGWLMEGGASVRVVKGTDLVGSLQYHRFDASFDPQVWSSVTGNQKINSTVTISYWSLRAGVVFCL